MANPGVDEILVRALELDPSDRLVLANELLESVEAPQDAKWGAAWLTELDRRAAEVEQDEGQLEDWADVKARLKGELGSA